MITRSVCAHFKKQPVLKDVSANTHWLIEKSVFAFNLCSDLTETGFAYSLVWFAHYYNWSSQYPNVTSSRIPCTVTPVFKGHSERCPIFYMKSLEDRFYCMT